MSLKVYVVNVYEDLYGVFDSKAKAFEEIQKLVDRDKSKGWPVQDYYATEFDLNKSNFESGDA